MKIKRVMDFSLVQPGTFVRSTHTYRMYRITFVYFDAYGFVYCKAQHCGGRRIGISRHDFDMGHYEFDARMR